MRDPLEKVRNIITNLVTKLKEEAAQDASQKAFCDAELSKSSEAKDDKSMRMDKLKSKVNSVTSSKASLEETVRDLESQIAVLDKGETEGTKIRQEEHATYERESREFKEAAEAVESAMTMLKEYYQGTASLVQAHTGKQPVLGSKDT